MSRRAEVTVRAPAKVNLSLVVGPPRDDGYHDLATVFQAVSLYDDVVVVPDERWSVRVDGAQADLVPGGDDNIALKAAQLLADRAGIYDPVRITIRKQIPVAGGMAGGSADAAATLVACDALWHTGLSREDLREVAAELGSDVPFALHGGTAIGTGRGDRLSSALARGEYLWVLALADTTLSTPAVYGELDRLRAGRPVPGPRVPDDVMQALRSGDPVALGAALHNDMEPAACSLAPPLERTLEVGREYGALGAVVSGSGPTCAFLAADTEQAMDLSVALTAAGVAADVRRVRGPVPGARVVDTVT